MEARGEMAVTPADVQVAAKPQRRSFTAEYKRRILKEADACTTPGVIVTNERRRVNRGSWMPRRQSIQTTVRSPAGMARRRLRSLDARRVCVRTWVSKTSEEELHEPA